MDLSIRRIQNYYKLIKSKRSLFKTGSIEQDFDDILQKSVPVSASYLGDSQGLKFYQDHHMSKNTLVSRHNITEKLKRPVVDRLRTEQNKYEPFSKRRDLKLKNLSYKYQRTQRLDKTQMAIEDLRCIGEISINKLDQNPENLIRFNFDAEGSSTKHSFQKWRTMSKDRHRNSNSPFKNRLSVGKRAKNSPKKTSNLRIRKSLINITKKPEYVHNLSTIESLNKLMEPQKIVGRKSSIAPWEIKEEDLY